MIKVKKTNFIKLFKDKNFNIPPFQRGYVWKKNEWNDLLNDIKNILEFKTNHFMGNILIKEKNNIFEIIDGQQRFITILLFIKAFEISYTTISKNRIEEISQSRLDINNRDNIFASIMNDTFNEEIETNNYSSKNIKRAFLHFKNQINKDSKSLFGNNITSDLKLYQVLNKLVFIEVRIDVNINPYLIFETLNARGVDLNISDLVKNHLIEKAQDKNFVTNEWQRLTNGLNENQFEELFQFFYNSSNNKKRLLKEITSDINSNENVRKFIQKLSIFTQTYKQLSKINQTYLTQGIQEYISYLNHLGNNLFKILAVPTKDKFKTREWLKVLKLLEVFIFRYIVICKKNKNSFKKKLFEIARKINNNEISTANEIYNLLYQDFFVDDEEFENAFSYISLIYSKRIEYDYNNQGLLVKYILYKIENFLRGDRLLSLVGTGTNDISIEHIKNESSNIPDAFKYRLGNYALMKESENNAAGQSGLDFIGKKEIYRKSTYLTIIGEKENSQVLKPLYEYNDFNEENIKNRQRELAKIAVNIWKLDGREFSLESSND